MEKETLYEKYKNDIYGGYLQIKDNYKNLPLSWYERSKESRRSLHDDVASILVNEDRSEVGKNTVIDWELKFRKECFYLGIRILLELERDSMSDL
jgi:hypothetical protein